MRIEEKCSFLQVPTVVTARNSQVDLFDIVLSNITDDQVVQGGIKAEPERVSQPIDKDLMYCPRLSQERIRMRDTILPIGADRVRTALGQCGIKWIDAQELTQHVGLILSIAFKRIVAVSHIVCVAAVAFRKIEIVISGPEGKLTPFVVELRVVDPHDFTARGWINHIGICLRDFPFSYDGLVIERALIGHGKISRAVDWLVRIGIDLVEPWSGGIVKVRVKGES